MQKTNFLMTFTILLFLSATSWATSAINLPQTGQTKCYDSTGTEIDCSETGQDGDIKAGILWPNPRFTESGDCVIDNLNSSMWSKNANLTNGTKTWQEALDYVAAINSGQGLCGYKDWHLPNINELASLLNDGEADSATWLNNQGFMNAQSSYWSSTTYYNSEYNSGGSAWIVNMYGTIKYLLKSSAIYVWPVRLKQSPEIAKTGQSKCYNTTGTEVSCSGTGQDGDIQAGVSWPVPRYTDNSDGSVTDSLTGLVWSKDANAPGPDICKPGISIAWDKAFDYIDCLNSNKYLGYNDWRMPNKKELFSMVDFTKIRPALQAEHPFVNVYSDTGDSEYWSSASLLNNPEMAVGIWLVNGWINVGPKTLECHIWPVRSMQSGSIDNSIITVSPPSKDFGNVNIGDTSSGQTFTIANSGTADLVISSIDMTGDDSGSFSIATGTCASLSPTIAAGSSCTISATFSPTSEGVKSTTLNIASNDPDTLSLEVSLTGTGVAQTCTFTLLPSNKSFAYKGASSAVKIKATGTGCSWTATSNNSWITIKSGSTGSGKTGSVSYSISTNTSSSQRTGTMTVAGQTFTVTQAGVPCKYAISPTSSKPVLSTNGGTGSLTVTPTPSDCSWTADVYSNAESWITVTEGSSGTGTGTISYSVSANETKKARTGKVNIIGSDSKVKKTFMVKQAK